ncbi:MAG: hypothetical protein ABSG76_11650, partial [Xanthobacteraceae bacterium]
MVAVARIDIGALEQGGFHVTTVFEIYGCVEAAVAAAGSETLIQWMSETRRRFFPLVADPDWGVRLHQADLAVNKVLAASSRTKARDFADLAAIATYMCPLGPLILAAAGKPPFYSPQRGIDEIRRRGLSVGDEEYLAVKGMPADWTPAFIRSELARHLDLAERYIMNAPLETIGVLAVNHDATPIEVSASSVGDAVLRKATEEPEVMPIPVDTGVADWRRSG